MASVSGVPSLDGEHPAGPVQRDSDDANTIKVHPASGHPVGPGRTGRTWCRRHVHSDRDQQRRVPLTDVAVTDNSYPACNRANLGDLAPGATTSYTCTVKAGNADVTNTATATGTPPDGPKPSDKSTSTIDVKLPGIEVVKVAKTPIVGVGDDATFELTVRNTGQIT